MAQDAFTLAPFGNGTPRWFLGTAAPTSGDYVVGDTVFNSAPTAAGTALWMCTTGGNPGTWKAVALAA